MQTDRAAPHSAHQQPFVGLEQRLLARARALACPAGSEILVGFSGGADSLALAAGLARIADKAGLQPRLAHVDHALRDISHEEQQQARRQAMTLNLPFHALRVGGHCRERHPGVGLEEAARRERYLALAGLVAERGAPLLALAHHATDQAETILLHLLRGAGLGGAAGMAERSTLPVPWWESPAARSPAQIEIWRPLLAESRHAVRHYAATLAPLGLSPIADPSNDDLTLRRNALRQRALPLLEQIAPGATAALARYGRLVVEDEAYLNAVALAELRLSGVPDDELAVAALARQPLALRRRIVRAWLRQRTGLPAISADRTEAVLGLVAAGEGGRRIEVGEGWVVTVRGGRIGCHVGLDDEKRVEGDAGDHW